MEKIIGIGNSLVDILVKLPDDSYLDKFELPKGSMVLVDAEKSHKIINALEEHIVQKTAGGSAANTINALAKLGTETSFIGKIGKDETGEFFKSDLINNGVKEKLFISNTETGKAATLISPDSERTFGTFLGASIELSASDLKPELFEDYNYCYVEGYLVQNHELIETACKLAKQKGLKICLDLASFNVVEDNLDFLKRIVRDYVDILFANEEEAKSFTGLDPEKALDVIAEQVDIAVVKIGALGSMIKKDGKIYKAGVIKVSPVDTTGAGDYYAAGFLYGLVNGFRLDQCGVIGAITSGHIVEVIGAKLKAIVWDEIKKQISKI